MVWTAEAVDNLDRIFTYVAAFNAAAEARRAQRLSVAANILVDQPERGRPIAKGLRELTVIHPYLIRYRVTEDAVIILRIRHGMRVQD